MASFRIKLSLIKMQLCPALPAASGTPVSSFTAVFCFAPPPHPSLSSSPPIPQSSAVSHQSVTRIGASWAGAGGPGVRTSASRHCERSTAQHSDRPLHSAPGHAKTWRFLWCGDVSTGQYTCTTWTSGTLQRPHRGDRAAMPAGQSGRPPTLLVR